MHHASFHGKPFFIVTIDTEGDNVWANRDSPTTRNAACLPRFQNLCEKYGVRPTYLVNYEMANAPAMQDFGRDVSRRKTAEIGMHLHAWNSPPYVAEMDQGNAKPFLIEYDQAAMEAKVGHMTQLLQDTFEVRIVSHRAGRWAFNSRYAGVLQKYGYTVDSSVTPGVDWRRAIGRSGGRGGPDYRRHKSVPYYIDAMDTTSGHPTQLLEVPVTTMDPAPWGLKDLAERDPSGTLTRALRKAWPLQWLRPTVTSLRGMCKVIDAACAAGAPHLTFAMHSSELMAGGSPFCTSDDDVHRLYGELDYLFSYAADRSRSATLGEFREKWAAL